MNEELYQEFLEGFTSILDMIEFGQQTEEFKELAFNIWLEGRK